jgi:hypothetical protein
VIGIDLGDEKQAIAVVDHDVRVVARKTVRVKAFRLGDALDWAVGQARAKGFTAVAVACEPTGPRWLQVQRLCAERELPLVCIQPLVSHIPFRGAELPHARVRAVAARTRGHQPRRPPAVARTPDQDQSAKDIRNSRRRLTHHFLRWLSETAPVAQRHTVGRVPEGI